jgi:hypothetical protein
MKFRDILLGRFAETVSEITIIKEAQSWIKRNSNILNERWKKPCRSELPEVVVKGRKYHYERCEETEKFAPVYFLHGKNGARYGLFRGNEGSNLFAMNMKNHKVIHKIGKFEEDDNGLYWIDPKVKREQQALPIEENKESKNLHLEHVEDRVIDLGASGAEESITFLKTIGETLSGTSENPSNITVKWDGSPSIFCGIDPETKRFFVGTKSVFNKTPKLNFTHEDIERNHKGGLVEKLHIALDNLPKLGIKNVLQGDMMFTRDDLEKTVIGGEEVIAFQPNTIVYAVPTNTELSREILQANIGIVFHTTYSGGPTLQDMKASFGADVSDLNKTPDVWVKDANYRDVSGTATMTRDETTKLMSIVSQANNMLDSYDAHFDVISQNENIRPIIKIYINSLVREGKFLDNPKTHVDGFARFFIDRGKDAIEKVNSPKAKQVKTEQLKESIDFIRNNRKGFAALFTFVNFISEGKKLIVKKLQQGQSLTKTFVLGSDGYEVTTPEGFVAIDRKGNAVKLVDRLGFSQQNFNAIKSWDKQPEKEMKEQESEDHGLTPCILTIGRFQGFQKGHDSLIQEAKKHLDRVGADVVAVAVVAGKGTTGDPKNPLTGPERIDMLSGIYSSDPQVKVLQEPFDAAFIIKAMIQCAQQGYYIKGWIMGTDRADSYISNINNFSEKKKYQQEVIDALGYLPVDFKPNGSVDIDPIIIDRDEDSELVSGKLQNLGDDSDPIQQQVVKMIKSTPKPVIPVEVISGTIVRNLIKVWNLPFKYWYKEVAPSLYMKNKSTINSYKLIYQRLKEILRSSKATESENLINFRNSLRKSLLNRVEEATDDPTDDSNDEFSSDEFKPEVHKDKVGDEGPYDTEDIRNRLKNSQTRGYMVSGIMALIASKYPHIAGIGLGIDQWQRQNWEKRWEDQLENLRNKNLSVAERKESLNQFIKSQKPELRKLQNSLLSLPEKAVQEGVFKTSRDFADFAIKNREAIRKEFENNKKLDNEQIQSLSDDQKKNRMKVELLNQFSGGIDKLFGIFDSATQLLNTTKKGVTVNNLKRITGITDNNIIEKWIETRRNNG